jgi:fructokinase
MKRRVFAVGETLLDIIFENGQPAKAVAGGSMVNTAVSLGRAKIHIDLISEFGNDQVGNTIGAFLENNQVNYSWSCRYEENKTSVAIAFLDERKNAEYTFYHDFPEEIQELALPDFGPEDIVLFGSFYSIRPQRRTHIKRILQESQVTRALVVYDPNVRKGHHGNKEVFLAAIFENFAEASIVKGSDDDFFYLFGSRSPSEIYSKMKEHCPFLFITSGSNDLVLTTPGFTASYKVPVIDPVSTIGAGDNFNAGLIYGLISEGVSVNNISNLSRNSWDKIANFGLEFAKVACLSFENYIPLGFTPVK